MNWDDHFKKVSRRATQPPADFGILGLASEKTTSDLRDLIAAKDDVFAQIEQHTQGVKVDPEWMRDWQNLKARYKVAHDAATAFLSPVHDAQDIATGLVLGPVGMVGATLKKAQDILGFKNAAPYYDGVLKAIQQSYPELHTSKGDLQDLYNRMPFALKPIPQPTVKGSDVLYQATDSAAQGMPTGVKGWVALTAPGLVPKTKDEQTYKDAKKNLIWGLSATSIALVAGGILVLTVVSKAK
jgi:hypothetical protein